METVISLCLVVRLTTLPPALLVRTLSGEGREGEVEDVGVVEEGEGEEGEVVGSALVPSKASSLSKDRGNRLIRRLRFFYGRGITRLALLLLKYAFYLI